MIRTIIKFTALFYLARWADRALAGTPASPRKLLSGPKGRPQPSPQQRSPAQHVAPL